MKSTILFGILLLSTVSFAAPVEFSCELNELKGEGEIIFKIKDLKAKNLELLFDYTDYEGESVPVTHSSGNEKIESFASKLNAQGGDAYFDNKENLILFGDDAGIDFVTLTLFKDKDFKYGYLRAEYSYGDDFFSYVNCKLK